MKGSGDFIPFLIFIAVMIGALIKKVKEFREQAEARQKLEPPRPEAVPEAMRRQIYGRTEIRTARPAKNPAQRVWLDEEGASSEDEESEEDKFERSGPQGPPPVTPQQQPIRPAPVRPAIQQPAVRRVAVPSPRPGPPVRQRAETRHPYAAPAQRPTPPPRPPARPSAGPLQVPVAAKASPAQSPQRKAEPASTLAKAQPARHLVHDLLGNVGDLRKAIILREILGPPKSLE